MKNSTHISNLKTKENVKYVYIIVIIIIIIIIIMKPPNCWDYLCAMTLYSIEFLLFVQFIPFRTTIN
jgi:hypothetical protein